MTLLNFAKNVMYSYTLLDTLKPRLCKITLLPVARLTLFFQAQTTCELQTYFSASKYWKGDDLKCESLIDRRKKVFTK